MKPGDRINVMDVHDNALLREIVAVEEDIVFVSRPEEVALARKESREPNCIGFRISDAIPVRSHK